MLLEAQGGADVSLVVPAHGSASAVVEPGISYLVAGSEDLRAAVSYAAVGRLAGYPIVSGRPGSGADRRPALTCSSEPADQKWR